MLTTFWIIISRPIERKNKEIERERDERKRGEETCAGNILGGKLLFSKAIKATPSGFLEHSGIHFFPLFVPLLPLLFQVLPPYFFPFTHTSNQSDDRKQVAQAQEPAFPSARLCKALSSIFKAVFLSSLLVALFLPPCFLLSLTSFLQRFTLCPIRHL